MAMIEVKEQCKGCFHFQVCANVLKQQLFIREKMLKEENPKCEQYIPTADVVEVVRCKDCKYNVANMKKDTLDMTDYSGDDIVCSYFMTDGLAPNDFCSQGTPHRGVE